ncbi:hypothetical protein NECAME_07798 [Necator americanus]|uniref:Receptor ligand binding region domain-containing protein n=1 Tax=Necator americanus TaxID=51031 RepID=W2TM33_NECAM|nr:hypothetical protein NECAME_07798 [Necator americanus]ETN82793.1 hypothetical protein NECAME_07798 [Necator americanus]
MLQNGKLDYVISLFRFSIIVRYDDCIEREAVGHAVELIRDLDVDVIIGPTCSIPAIAVGVMTAYYNLPQYVWGFTTANELAEASRFPTVTIMTPNYFTLSLALLSIMKHFEWDQFAFVYSGSEDNQKCPIFLTDIQKAVFQNPSFTISTVVEMRNVTTTDITSALRGTSAQARTLGRTGNNTAYVWEDRKEVPDGRDQEALQAFKRTFMISDGSTQSLDQDNDKTSALYNFTLEVSQRMAQPPISCTNCNMSKGWEVSDVKNNGKLTQEDKRER